MKKRLFSLFALSQLGLLLLMMLTFPLVVAPLKQRVGTGICIGMMLVAFVLFMVGLFVVAVLFDKIPKDDCKRPKDKDGLIVFIVCNVYFGLLVYLSDRIYNVLGH